MSSFSTSLSHGTWRNELAGSKVVLFITLFVQKKRFSHAYLAARSVGLASWKKRCHPSLCRLSLTQRNIIKLHTEWVMVDYGFSCTKPPLGGIWRVGGGLKT
jgi:hypothetical protein